jgi:hypothetical protein
MGKATVRKNIFGKENSIFDFAINVFLFSGSLYFIYYSFRTARIFHFLLSFFVYILTRLIRKRKLKWKYYGGVTEAGVFLLSFLLTGYLLYVLKIDTDIENFISRETLSALGALFLVSFILSFLNSTKNTFCILVSTVLVIALAVIAISYMDYVDIFFVRDTTIVGLIRSSPLIYLLITVLGLNNLFIKKEESA